MQNSEVGSRKSEVGRQNSEAGIWKSESTFRLPPTASRRRGISMLEVLISIGIVAIGLLSIAALIPVGGIQVQKSNTQERKATLGLNAFREFQVRGMDDFSKTGTSPWLRENGSNYLPLADPTYLPPVAIDPLMMARTVNDDAAGAINSGSKSASQELQYFPISPSGNPPAVVMHRLSLSGLFSFGNPNSTRSATVSKALAEAVFAAQDDLVSALPDDRSQAGTGQMIADASGNLVKRDYEGKYSWLATLTPYYPNATMNPPAANDLYILSVVVFSDRTFPPSPSLSASFDNSLVREAMVTVQQPPMPMGVLPSPNIGGGEVVLTGLSDDQISMAQPGSWLMLCRNDTSLGRIFQWYRVVAASSANSGNLQLTLAGSDWSWGDMTTIPPQQTYACLFDGAVGVYQKVIHLEGPSKWNQ